MAAKKKPITEMRRSVARFFARPVLELAFRMAGRSKYSALVNSIAQRRNLHILHRHFYSPIPDADDFGPGFWDEKTELVGVDMGADRALALMDTVFPKFLPEFREIFPIEREPNSDGFHLINGGYMAVDAHVYWSLIRHLRPRRIIEVGVGNSTLLALEAVAANRETNGAECDVTAIEPYPSNASQRRVRDRLGLVEKKVQDVDLALFEELDDGDILFIDSSHVLREGNDVLFEYTEILPRLRPGVWVHIHDVSLPRRYPKVYFESGLFWNEQYLLQAFLAFNSRFEVVWPGNYMMLNHPQPMLELFPEFEIMRQHYPMSEPSAFWIRVKSS